MDQLKYAREAGFCTEKMWSVTLQISVHCMLSTINSSSSIGGDSGVWMVVAFFAWYIFFFLFGSSEGFFMFIDVQMQLR